ncbi:MAG: GNAT family N-acetyltransferase [Gemmatimonadetes bacterium]|nr:GNAT family N-acetyltransferase [Gemmatimonadota bacterium]
MSGEGMLRSLGHELRLDLGDDGYLAPLGPDDVTDLYITGLNDPEVNRFLSGPRKEYQTRETVRAFVAANEASDDTILFGLFVEGVLRGTVRLHDVSAASAYVGLAFFDKRIWGRGWAKRALVRVCAFAFDAVGTKQVLAGVHDVNEGSRRAFEGVGFRPVEGKIDDKGMAYTVWSLHPGDLLATR